MLVNWLKFDAKNTNKTTSFLQYSNVRIVKFWSRILEIKIFLIRFWQFMKPKLPTEAGVEMFVTPKTVI